MQVDFKSSISKISADMESLYNELLEEKGKNRQIIQALDFGLFLLDAKFNIQNNYSLVFEEIINQKNFVDQNFIELLENKVPENIVYDTREYLNFMFQEDLDEETIKETNPLTGVEFNFENQSGLWISSKHLSFNFKRIIRNEKIVDVIGTVRDITEEVAKTLQLEKIEENTKKHMEWLVKILHVEPPLLQEFINVVTYELDLIDSSLKNPPKSDGKTKILKIIDRCIHNINNNSSFLDLKFFTSKAQQFEQEINYIKNKHNISGSDFIPVVIQLEEMRQMLNEIQILMQQMEHFEISLRTTRGYEGGLLIKSIENLIQKLCSKSDKQIIFKYHSFDSSSIPYTTQQLIKEILIVLTRFSVLYSIEKPEERKNANKDPKGTIEIETFTTNRTVGIKFRHDGRLVRVERFLHKAMESDDIDEDSSQLGTQVVNLLFMPSITPSNLNEAEDSKEAFRNMTIVKKKLKMHGGKMKITFTSEQYCEYTISLPMKKEKRV